MEYTTLGSSDIRVSAVGFGCWGVAGGGHAAKPRPGGLDSGITFFDTAEAYGDGYSEEVVGKALVGRRSRAVVATKASPNHFGANGIVSACENSLRRLRTHYIDLYQLHWPNHEQPIQDTIAGVMRLFPASQSLPDFPRKVSPT
jgi:myo-inositol catabolism protein IolS